MHVELHAATKKDLSVVKNLCDFYVYDISEWCGFDFRETGRIGGVDNLPDYWRLPGHHAFVIRVDGRLAGFVCVKRMRQRPSPLHDIGEFFVVRKYRGKGVGRQVAHQIFDRFPGKWQVRQLRDNVPAIRFWRKIIRQYTRGVFTEKVLFARRKYSQVAQYFKSKSRPLPDKA